MKIHWFGHSSFLLQDSFGRRIIIDPYDLNFSKKILTLNPEAITLSHEHGRALSSFFKAHNNLFLNEAVNYNSSFITINGFNQYHDNVNGLKRGNNTIYLYHFDKIKICHLGHLGHILSDEMINLLGKIDILFVPIGGHFTLDGYDASILCKKINANIIIPMQFKNRKTLAFLDGPKKFLSLMNNIVIAKEQAIDSDYYLDNNKRKILLLKEGFIN